MTNAIEVRALRKTFGRTTALDGLDLAVRSGEVHAFLGPNGAGKTTTIRVLLGLLRKDGGEVSLLGADPWRDAVELHRRLAYVPGDVTLWPGLTGGEIIDLLGRLRGGINASRRKALTERFDLDTSKRARAYSRGNRQKVALIAALASGAELLMLDEPTAGLDPLMEATFRDCVTEERRDGRTILLSSHLLAEAEALSDRVTIIRAGKTVETGPPADMRHRTAQQARLPPRCRGTARVRFWHRCAAGYHRPRSQGAVPDRRQPGCGSSKGRCEPGTAVPPGTAERHVGRRLPRRAVGRVGG